LLPLQLWKKQYFEEKCLGAWGLASPNDLATSSATMITRTHQVDIGLKKLLGKVECTTPASKKFQAS
jgi:hypothetical protein